MRRETVSVLGFGVAFIRGLMILPLYGPSCAFSWNNRQSTTRRRLTHLRWNYIKWRNVTLPRSQPWKSWPVSWQSATRSCWVTAAMWSNSNSSMMTRCCRWHTRTSCWRRHRLGLRSFVFLVFLWLSLVTLLSVMASVCDGNAGIKISSARKTWYYRHFHCIVRGLVVNIRR